MGVDERPKLARMEQPVELTEHFLLFFILCYPCVLDFGGVEFAPMALQAAANDLLHCLVSGFGRHAISKCALVMRTSARMLCQRLELKEVLRCEFQ